MKRYFNIVGNALKNLHGAIVVVGCFVGVVSDVVEANPVTSACSVDNLVDGAPVVSLTD